MKPCNQNKKYRKFFILKKKIKTTGIANIVELLTVVIKSNVRVVKRKSLESLMKTTGIAKIVEILTVAIKINVRVVKMKSLESLMKTTGIAKIVEILTVAIKINVRVVTRSSHGTVAPVPSKTSWIGMSLSQQHAKFVVKKTKR